MKSYLSSEDVMPTLWAKGVMALAEGVRVFDVPSKVVPQVLDLSLYRVFLYLGRSFFISINLNLRDTLIH